MPARCCFWRAMKVTVATGSRRDCSRPILSSRPAASGILAVLGPESIVGELSMIDGAPRSASVVVSPCHDPARALPARYQRRPDRDELSTLVLPANLTNAPIGPRR